MTYFNASAPPPEPARDPLQSMEAAATHRNLEDALDRVRELTLEADGDPIPPEIVEHAEEITSADDAPLAFQSLRRRVRSGHTSWQAWWDDPTSEAEGMRLFQAVLEAVSEQGRDLIENPQGPPKD